MHSVKLTRRALLKSSGAGLALPAILRSARAATPAGNLWLRTHMAGAGRYRLANWQPSDHITLEANPHASVPPALPRLVNRHMDEPSARLLSLMAGDVDVARILGADELKPIAANANFGVASEAQAVSLYLGMNETLPQFSHPDVRQAVKWAIDYDAIAKNLTSGLWSVCQSFLPGGIPGAMEANPFRKDVARARQLWRRPALPKASP